MAWIRICLTICLGLGLIACGDDGGPGQGTQSTTNDSADSGTSNETATAGPDCVPGQLDCSCPCMGGTYCVEDVCVLGPEIDIGEGRAVVAGVVVPHEVGVMAEDFAWSQESGPAVEILGGDTLNIAVAVPPDTPPGETIRLRLEASRNGVTLEEFWDIAVIEAVFQDALPGISDPAQLGTTEGLSFGPMGMYVVSTEGFVSLFNSDGEHVETYDVGGSPAGANFMGENLLVANTELGSVQRLNSVSGNLSVLFDSVGQVDHPLVDGDGDGGGNVFVSTGPDQTVLYYDGQLGSTSVFLEDPALVDPSTLAFGPEGNTVYVGSMGHVWRVPLVDGGGAGEPTDYLDLGDDTCGVDGLAFDEGNNLWVGCSASGTLHVAHYSVMGAAEISRTFDTAGAGVSGFVNLRFGGGDFDDRSLYYSNLGGGTVGQLRVGLSD